MPNEQLVMTLGKVLIATAWVDGEVSWTEINCLKDLLFKMTALTGRDWARLQIYVETPVSPQERARLLSDLKQAIASPDDRATALSVLEDVCQADGLLTQDERVVFDEIKQTIAEAQTGLFGSMSKLLRGALVRRSDALANAPNREQHFEAFIRRKIYYKLSRRLEVDETDIKISDSDLRKLCAAGGLMARIAHADDEIADEEFKVICEALQNGWGVSRQQAALAAEIAISEVGTGLDLHRITRAFFDSTDHEERSRFLEVLFAVAEAHDGKSHDEIEEVRKIARMLRVSHGDFIRAKLKDSSS
jgi:uncharacterized tellurite resistance protein B-like protein